VTRFTTLSTVIALTVATLATSTSVAQPSQTSNREMRISLADAIALSLENNPDLAAAGLAPRRAAADIKQQEGVFMPTLSLFAGIDRDRLPQSSVALGTFRNNVAAEARIAGRLQWGTEYNLSYGTTRLESDSQFTPTSPMSSAYVQLQVRQPLLRGFGSDINRAGITIARGNVKIADAALRRTTEVAVATTVDAYWRLVRSHKSLAVARESLQLAERLVERTQSRVTAGDLPTIELTQARASVAARQEAVIVGEAEVGNANDSLARLLVVDPRQVFAATFVPTDEPNGEPAVMTQSTLLDEAFRQRGELFAARQSIKNAEVAVEVAINARKPDLSVVGSVGIGGLGSKWTSAQSQLARDVDDQHRWTAGLVFSVPLDNRAANGGYEKARLALDEAKLALRSLELQVTEEVRNALRNLDASAKRVEATRRAAELARDQLAAGEKRLASGLSTAFEVLRLQTDLAAAQNAEIAAVIGYRTSVIRVQFATGGLFGRYVTNA
jgi:outer membrane protein